MNKILNAICLNNFFFAVKALYNFAGMSEDDLPFEKGELLEVDESV